MTKWIIEKRLYTEKDNEEMSEGGWEPFAVDGGYIYWRKSS